MNNVPMSWRERYLTAARMGQPDAPAVVLGVGPLWAMRFAGVSSWDMFYKGTPSYTDVYLDMVRNFDFCGWLCANLGGSARALAWTDEVTEQTPDHLRARYSVHTKHGDLTKLTHFPRIDAPWDIEPLVKDPPSQYREVLDLLSEDPWEMGAEPWLEARDKMGDHGMVFGNIGLFFEWWHGLRAHAGTWLMDFYDYPELMKKLWTAFYEREMELAKAYFDRVNPDSLMIQGSTSSMSLISPELFRRVNLPFLQELTATAKSRGVLTELHVCGKSWEVLEMMATETDLNVMQPLERAPGGNVDMTEAKRAFGARICLHGNVQTTETLDKGTPEDVDCEVRQVISSAGDGGGFILGTGDQIPGTAPEDNLWAYIEAGKKYGLTLGGARAL